MKYNSSNQIDNANNSNCGMNEVDTEASVEWPSWCYTGETSSTDDASAMVKNLPVSFHHSASFSQQLKSASIAASLNAIAAAAAASSQIQKFRGKRKSQTGNSARKTSSIEKMLTDRLDIDDNKTYCDVNSSAVDRKSFSEKGNEETDNSEIGARSTSAMDYFKMTSNNGDSFEMTTNNNNNNNNNIATNNNTNIKDERLSPLQQQQPQDMTQTSIGIAGTHLSISRSRSATPSSNPTTSPPPPQNQTGDIMVNSNYPTSLASSLSTGNIKPEFPSTRTYSDQLRNFAAKYNALNESNNTKTSLSDSGFNLNIVKSGTSKDSSASPENSKRSNSTAAVRSPISNPSNNLISTLFSSFPSSTFPSLIDMRGSQLLLSLAQAAKENEFKKQILNGPTKRLTKYQPSQAHSNPLLLQQSPTSNATSTPLQNRNALTNPLQFLSMQPKSSSSNQSSSSVYNQSSSSTRYTTPPLSQSNRAKASSPLDLSAAPVGGNRFTSNFKETPDPKRKRISVSPTAIQPSFKKIRAQTPGSDTNLPAQNQRRCHSQTDEINSWTVDQVCDFVGSIDICAGYVENFRDQCIDGSGLPLLTEDHLMNSLNMKLGPALKLRSVLLKKIGGPCPCVSCTCTVAALGSVAVGCSAPSPSGSNHRPSSTDSGT